MECELFRIALNVIFLFLILHSPLKFIQSPMDFGPLNFLQATESSSLDFGRMFFYSPSAVLRPKSPQEISFLLKSLSVSSFNKVAVAAKGNGHSIHGQAQALNGIVIEMDSLPKTIKITHKRDGENAFSYVDVNGGTLWIELLMETLKQGLAPRSWTDYLYLTIGGTLSNAGISGQTFKHGPQISNVLQMDVITGTGELVVSSPTQNSELFYSVLGGLGQFGIITSARILLEDAPQKVKWIRAFYDDFQKFTKDQEFLITMEDMVDYVEGFVVYNEQSLHSSSVSFPSNMNFSPQFNEDGPTIYYCIEFAIYSFPQKGQNAEKVADKISKQLSFVPSWIYGADISYFDFLDRVSLEERELKKRGLWDVPHPWLNMFVPKSGIYQFRDLLLRTILPDGFEGPILMYPFLSNKWNSNSSAVLPDSGREGIIYAIGLLRSVNPSTCSSNCLKNYLNQNSFIVKTVIESGIGAKQYLPQYSEEQKWRRHFGGKWDKFVQRKSVFDPQCILAPGLEIFKRKCTGVDSFSLSR